MFTNKTLALCTSGECKICFKSRKEMEDAPLNLAHFHERRANKHLKYHRFDDAVNSLEKSLYYIQEAYKTVQMPKAIEVLIIQEKEYKKQIRQINYKKVYYETLKQADDNSRESNLNEELVGDTPKNSDELKEAIDKTIKEFDAKYSFKDTDDTISYLQSDKFDNLLELDFKSKDIPNLAPLELPSFDFKVFQRTSSNYFKKTNDSYTSAEKAE